MKLHFTLLSDKFSQQIMIYNYIDDIFKKIILIITIHFIVCSLYGRVIYLIIVTIFRSKSADLRHLLQSICNSYHLF